MSDAEDQSTGLDLSARIITTAILSAAFVIVILIVLHLYNRCVLGRRATIVLFRVTDDANEAGALRTIASSLPGFAYRRDHGKDCASAECAICLSAIDEGEMIRFLPNCKHLFHVECIDMWLHSHCTCPVCRARVQLEVGPSEPGLVSSLGSSLRRMMTVERRLQGDGPADLERH